MAETTRRKPLTKKVAVKKDKVPNTTPKRRAVKIVKSGNLFTTYATLTKQKISGAREFIVKMPRSQKYSIGIAVLLILFLLAFKNLFVVAIVNGQPITRLEVVKQLEKQNGKKTLDDLITKTLIIQEGQKNGVSVTDNEVDEQMKKIEESVAQQGEKLEDALAAQGITKTELIENIRLNKTIEKLVASSITVTDKEVNDYLEANKDSLPKDASPEATKKQATDALKNEKESEKAQELVARLKKEAKINYFINY